MEILNEITLATKYKEQLDDIVNKYMEELSYEYDFLYFDYDKKEESYYFDLYLDGERTREYLSKDDAKGMESKNGTLWRIQDEDSIFESEDLKDNIKINVECEIDMLDWKSKNGKQVNMEENYKNKVSELVEKGAKNIKEKSIPLNNGKPIFEKSDFNLVEGEPIYFELDELGRSNGAIAILSKYTIPLVIKRI